MSKIKLEIYNQDWSNQFKKEKKRILEAGGEWVIQLEHVGSTAVQGMQAKPTIDMCLSVHSLAVADKSIIPMLEELGYEYLAYLEDMIPERRYCQRLHADGRHLFHVHIVEQGRKIQQDYLLFRDYLITHPKDASDYAQLKSSLSKQFSDDRNAYTDGKALFIQTTLDKARKLKSV